MRACMQAQLLIYVLFPYDDAAARNLIMISKFNFANFPALRTQTRNLAIPSNYNTIINYWWTKIKRQIYIC